MTTSLVVYLSLNLYNILILLSLVSRHTSCNEMPFLSLPPLKDTKTKLKTELPTSPTDSTPFPSPPSLLRDVYTMAECGSMVR
jgi:hypothetical protein